MNLSDTDFDFVRTLVRRESAIVVDESKKYLVATRLADLAATRFDGDIGRLVDNLRGASSAGLRYSVVEAMAIQETLFFRDPAFYEVLRDQVLPALVRKRQAQRRLRLWCAACSTGQEPYSICMLLREHFPQLADWRIEFIASDFSSSALRRASNGHYSMLEVNRGLPVRMLTRHFTQRGLDWEISTDIRRMVDFRQVNLVDAWPEVPSFDIIFLRNVLIYFDLETRRQVLARCREHMVGDGCLFLGGTETVSGLHDAFRPYPGVRTGSCFELAGGG